MTVPRGPRRSLCARAAHATLRGVKRQATWIPLYVDLLLVPARTTLPLPDADAVHRAAEIVGHMHESLDGITVTQYVPSQLGGLLSLRLDVGVDVPPPNPDAPEAEFLAFGAAVHPLLGDFWELLSGGLLGIGEVEVAGETYGAEVSLATMLVSQGLPGMGYRTMSFEGRAAAEDGPDELSEA